MAYTQQASTAFPFPFFFNANHPIMKYIVVYHVLDALAPCQLCWHEDQCNRHTITSNTLVSAVALS